MERAVPILKRHLFDRIFKHDPGIVDEHVQAAMTIDYLLDDLLGCFRF